MEVHVREGHARDFCEVRALPVRCDGRIETGFPKTLADLTTTEVCLCGLCGGVRTWMFLQWEAEMTATDHDIVGY